MDEGRLYLRQSKDNPLAYVLSWTSYAAAQAGDMNINSAQNCTRSRSAIACRMTKGDTHGDNVRRRIASNRKGKKWDEATKLRISESCRGKKRLAMTQAEKDQRSATRKAILAAKRSAFLTGGASALCAGAFGCYRALEGK